MFSIDTTNEIEQHVREHFGYDQRHITLAHLLPAFKIWTLGLGIAGYVCILEIIFFKYKRNINWNFICKSFFGLTFRK